MPWEKSFDLDDATDKAAAVFWAKGYEATSISDLVAAMGINKGSLYNAFGDKRRLFIRALTRYDAKRRSSWMAGLEQMNDPVAAIGAFFDRIVEQSCSEMSARGCFIVNTALEAPQQTPAVQQLVAASLADIQAFFRRSIERGKAAGEIDTALEADEVAKTMVALMMGMRVLSRTGVAHDDLAAMRAQALRLLIP
ncbi:MAG: TetR/AcrR family transcriptional regulator [Pikeienuella sp.]